MHRLKTLASAVVVALVVITCLDYAASAATGGTFVLGKLNKANRPTALKRTTSGPALKLATAPSSAPLEVNGTGKVANLNTDRVDGLDSKTLRNHSYVFTAAVSTPTQEFTFALPVPTGTYEFSYSALLPNATGYLWCKVAVYDEDDTLTRSVGWSRTPADATSGAGVVTKGAGETIAFNCLSDSPVTTMAGAPAQVVLTPTVATAGAPLTSIN